MSRKPRIHFPEVVYHVICPGPEEKIPNNQSLIIPPREQSRLNLSLSAAMNLYAGTILKTTLLDTPSATALIVRSAGGLNPFFKSMSCICPRGMGTV